MERTGYRCRSKKLISGSAATIKPNMEGTIIYEIENMGRRLINVQWDNDSMIYVFPEEIEVIVDASGGQDS